MARERSSIERERPRLELLKYRDAEERLRAAILEGRDYEGKEEDFEIVRRKKRELGFERYQRFVGGGGGRGCSLRTD